ncbi:hypothetical protein [Amycolatopsis magusensis]|uniref:hypothetical protein n=1 Tax=Amycolatopsis magusensis TaxID=882444 RepID=UPI0037ADD9AC
MPEGGYRADADAMAVAQTRLKEQVGKPAARAERIMPPKLKPGEFGRIHAHHFDAYNAGVEQLAAALKGLSSELTALAGGIGAAGQSYAGADQANAVQINQQAGY